jgi:hypothetical protein
MCKQRNTRQSKAVLLLQKKTGVHGQMKSSSDKSEKDQNDPQKDIVNVCKFSFAFLQIMQQKQWAIEP